MDEKCFRDSNKLGQTDLHDLGDLYHYHDNVSRRRRPYYDDSDIHDLDDSDIHDLGDLVIVVDDDNLNHIRLDDCVDDDTLKELIMKWRLSQPLTTKTRFGLL